MEGEQIPKATMNNFIKSRLGCSFSAQFSNKMLLIAKEYVGRLTQEANEVCTKMAKSNINSQHFEAALKELNLVSQIPEMLEISNNLKQQNQMKQEFRQRIRENIEKNLQEENGEFQEVPRVVPIKEKIGSIQIKGDSEEQYDYEAEINREESRSVQEIGSMSQKQEE